MRQPRFSKWRCPPLGNQPSRLDQRSLWERRPHKHDGANSMVPFGFFPRPRIRKWSGVKKRKRGDCVATERSGLPANKVSGIPDAGSGWVAGRDGCCLSKKKRGRLVLVATLVAIRVCVMARVLPSVGPWWWVTRREVLPGGVHGHGLQVHHSDRRVRRVHRGRGACLRLCRRVRPVRRGVRDRHGRQVRLQAGLG